MEDSPVQHVTALLRACLPAVKCRHQMINYPDVVWTKPQVKDHLDRVAQLFQSKMALPSLPVTRQSQIDWIELIRGVSDLVGQAALMGRRIRFTDEVNPWDHRQDITTLLEVMRQSAHVVEPLSPAQQHLTFISPAFNQISGVGWGHFANGLFYACPYPNEQTFFIGRDRIYLYRHLMRAYVEARQCLLLSEDAA